MLARRQAPYDVCIVGSGAGGGMAAYALTRAGARVVMLEAGPAWYASKNSQMITPSYATPHARRGDAHAARSASSTRATAAGRSTASRTRARRARSFDWWRGRMLGGRTNHWGRISLRFGPEDFRGKTRDGLGDDWPIGYDDSRRIYDQVDDLIGVFGSKEGIHNEPDGKFHAAAEAALLRAAGQEGVRQAEDHLHPVASLDHHEGEARPAGVPLLRPVQPRLSGEGELLQPRRAHRAGARDGQAHAAHQLDGARGHRRTRRSRDRRVVHRQGRAARTRHVAARSRRARGERVRVGAAAAQLQVVALPAGTRQLERRGRQVHHRHDRNATCRATSHRWSTTSRTTRTASAACTSTCPGGSTTRSSTSRAATTSRSAAGCDPPAYGFMGGIQRYPGKGGYGSEAQGRLSPLLRRDDRLLRARRADPERQVLHRDRSQRGRPVRHPGAALPLGVDGPRATIR